MEEDETWLGFYIEGKKVGYSYQKFQIAKDHFRFYNRTKMRMRMGRDAQELLATTDCATAKDFSLQRARFELISQKQRVKLNGLVKDNTLYLEIFTEKGVRRGKIPVDEKIYPVFAISKIVYQRGAKKGSEYSLPVFEPIINQVITAKITIEDEEEVKLGDSIHKCTRAKVNLANNISTYWISEGGRLIKEELPPKILAIKESPQEALAAEKGEEMVDIISYFSIKADTVIPNPSGLEYMKVEITGINPADFDLNLADQRLLSTTPSKTILEIRVPNLGEKPVAISPTKEREFLKPSLYIQSDDEDVKKKAREIKGEREDAKEVAKRILFWVYENLRKVPTASLPSAVSVLKNMEGDCNEHSILFTALCRAVGIPAQVCVGLVYTGGSFFYHAWNLVYLERWVACDPTFGEFPANPTHIILKVGEIEEQAKVLGAVGNIKIKVLEFN